jgi:hypothetical protein
MPKTVSHLCALPAALGVETRIEAVSAAAQPGTDLL